MNTLPRFLAVGCAKGGTTSLYYVLKAQQELFLADVKETHFLVSDQSRLGQGNGFTDHQLVQSLDAYQALFRKAPAGTLPGEICNAYLYLHTESIPMIKNLLGDPKIIIVLREPVSRTFSGYLHLVREGLVDESFAECLQREEARIRDNWWWGFHIRSISFYADAVDAYQRSFSNVLVLDYNVLQTNPERFYDAVFSFLGIRGKLPRSAGQRLNKTGVPRSSWLAGILRNPSPVKTVWQAILPTSVRQRMSVLMWNILLQKPRLAGDMRFKLRQDFLEDVCKLDQLVPGIKKEWKYDEV
jgi:hypothetical protein